MSVKGVGKTYSFIQRRKALLLTYRRGCFAALIKGSENFTFWLNLAKLGGYWGESYLGKVIQKLGVGKLYTLTLFSELF